MIAVFRAQPGIASARRGHVILDGPNTISAVMTPATARRLAESLMAAAATADTERGTGDACDFERRQAR